MKTVMFFNGKQKRKIRFVNGSVRYEGTLCLIISNNSLSACLKRGGAIIKLVANLLGCTKKVLRKPGISQWRLL